MSIHANILQGFKETEAEFFLIQIYFSNLHEINLKIRRKTPRQKSFFMYYTFKTATNSYYLQVV